MAATIPPATSLNDPNLMFTEDIIADPSVAPQIFDDTRTPNLRNLRARAGAGKPGYRDGANRSLHPLLGGG